MAWQHPTGKVPEKVVIVGGGTTRTFFLKSLSVHEDVWKGHEVWGLNTGIRWLKKADMFFLMDDMDLFGHNFPDYGRDMENETRPILTSHVYPQYPTAIEYPLIEMMEFYGPTVRPYFHDGSGGYLLAYAGFVGVKELNIFGMDYAAHEAREEGRECAEFWAGVISARGTRVKVSTASTFLNENQTQKKLYGYLKPPTIRTSSGRILGFNNQSTRPHGDPETPGNAAPQAEDSGHRERERPPCAIVPGSRP